MYNSDLQDNKDKRIDLYGVDVDFVLNNIGGDTDFLKVLLGVFYEDKKDVVCSLKTCLSGSCQKDFVEQMHSFLGAAANCGVDRAEKLGRKIYNRAKTEGIGAVEVDFIEFEEEVEKVMAGVSRYISV